MEQLIEWVGAGVLGMLVGIVEILSRYRRAPWHALSTFPAFFYILLNIAASLAALFLLRLLGWTPSRFDFSLEGKWFQILVAGLGALIILRLTLTVSVANLSIPLSPGKLFEILFAAAIKSLELREASRSFKAVRTIMRGIPFNEAYDTLPPLCLHFIRASDEEQRKFGEIVNALRDSQASDQLKSDILGLALLDLADEKFLKMAVSAYWGPPKKRAP